MKNKITNEELDNVISTSDNGTVYSDKNSWKFIPSKLTEDNKEIASEYNDTVEYKTIKKSDSVLKEKEPEEYYVEKAQYVFGFKFKDLRRYDFSKCSYAISKEINLGSFSYITIEVDAPEESTAEYYIMAGDQNIPITPSNKSNKIYKEKMFYGLNQRFIVDKSSYSPIIYEDGIETNKTLISYSDYNEHDYRITYMAGGEIYKVIPPSSNIRLKVILRDQDTISNIIIKKHGGTMNWN